ncbi:hypothetical protein F5884DRAFT_278894 [Xylogone sp. PMI_703]|nr:hypothetical protein F5884DRAFT_278894 [Xylogone sp. PMI_703]
MNGFDKNKSTNMRSGNSFEPIKDLQRRCARVRYGSIADRTRSKVLGPEPDVDQAGAELPVKTEETVNMALLLLLNFLTTDFMEFNEWSAERKLFKVDFSSKKYKCRTDGFLEDENMSGSTRAILEAKRSRRIVGQHRILMQETATMVAWISNDTKAKCRKKKKNYIQICQDRNEIYIAVPEFGDQFLLYLEGERILPQNHEKSFLTMHQFGPWYTSNKEHMEEVGAILLGIGLRAENEAIVERGL